VIKMTPEIAGGLGGPKRGGAGPEKENGSDLLTRKGLLLNDRAGLGGGKNTGAQTKP